LWRSLTAPRLRWQDDATAQRDEGSAQHYARS
jgi:hypothetical protein